MFSFPDRLDHEIHLMHHTYRFTESLLWNRMNEINGVFVSAGTVSSYDTSLDVLVFNFVLHAVCP